MAINYLSEQGEVKYGVHELVLDTSSDVASLPKDCRPGSTAIVIETGDVYMMNSKGEWKML